MSMPTELWQRVHVEQLDLFGIVDVNEWQAQRTATKVDTSELRIRDNFRVKWGNRIEVLQTKRGFPTVKYLNNG